MRETNLKLVNKFPLKEVAWNGQKRKRKTKRGTKGRNTLIVSKNETKYGQRGKSQSTQGLLGVTMDHP